MDVSSAVYCTQLLRANGDVLTLSVLLLLIPGFDDREPSETRTFVSQYDTCCHTGQAAITVEHAIAFVQAWLQTEDGSELKSFEEVETAP